ncbi:lipid-A-disaccharide synthase [Pseudaestuariivita atlantica]|uniref:Lipid-A-disaccharide synthase n=2 Tax=Pseudaestuariivita atlantica TaxID=1317121 RepID=A0A0L1JN68_9RHOB|nr:lipid-A-disaccharide synthase [Pseudaestuariivita atlantica]
MEGLQARLGAENVTFEGVGGPMMEARGLSSIFPMDDISIMGLGAILRKYGHLKARIRETAEAAVASGADALITIDLPEFCLRVAKAVKAQGDMRTVHYVAPTVWAWRPGRAKRMAAHVDHVLALFPFEPPYMEAAGMECDFVGHPVVTEPVATDADASAFRAAHGIGDAPLLMVLPGSRRSEVGMMLPILEDAVTRLTATRPDLRLVVPLAGPVADTVRAAVASWPGQPILVPPGTDSAEAMATKRAAFRAADVALATSGTVALELAASDTPMVVGYTMGWLSRQVIGRMLLTDTVNLVNLVSETRTVPERIGEACTGAALAEAMAGVLDDPSGQRAAMATTMQRLGQGGPAPGLRAADAVLSRLG